MSITITDKPASERSIKFLTDLATKRDWRNVLQGQLYETALDALGNVGNPDPKFISQREASKAIDALLKIKPPAQVVGVGVNTHVGFAAVDHSLLTQVLATLPLSKYALPRRSDPTIWDFFEVIERKNGTRYLNRLGVRLQGPDWSLTPKKKRSLTPITKKWCDRKQKGRRKRRPFC